MGIYDGLDISEIDGIDLSTDPSDDDILKFDLASNTWKPEADAGDAGFAGLSDTNIVSPIAGHIAIYDGVDTWDNKAMSGNATLSASGVLTIASLAVTESMLSSAVASKLNNTVPNNVSGTAAPGVNNDINDTTNASDGIGFQVGSLWVDAVADEAYRCVDNTDGAAVWVNTTLSTSELANIALSGSGADLTSSSVANSALATMAANTVKVNATASTTNPADLAMPASTILARLSTGNVVAATTAQLRTLINVADGATANSSDAVLLARANHTGTQTAATISDFDTEVANNSAVTLNTAKVTNQTHTGEVTGSVGLTITNNAVTLAKMATMATASFLGRVTASTGNVEVLTATNARSILNVADGATANSADAVLLARANHTGTQTASTISDFDTEVVNNSAVVANTGKVSADGSVTSHSDVTNAGSGLIITASERSNITASVTVHSDVSSSGSGIIISTAERNKIDFLTVTQAVDLDTIESDTGLNNTHRNDSTLHRVINDAGTSLTELWSANKISADLAAVSNNADMKDGVRTVATSNVTLSGLQTINGYTLQVGDRVAPVAQTNGAENGIYIAAVGAWTRSTDMDADSEISNGTRFAVGNSSSTKNGFSYICTTSDTITIGVTVTAWTEIKRIEFGVISGTAAEGNDSRILSAFTHITSTGADHTFINQSVTSTSNPTFNSLYLGTGSIETNAILQIDSTTQYFLLSRMTNTQRDGITSPTAGAILYDNVNNKVDFYNGGSWRGLLHSPAGTLSTGGIIFATEDGHGVDDDAGLTWDNATKELSATNTKFSKLIVASGNPIMQFEETDHAGVDDRKWRFQINAGIWKFETLNNAETAFTPRFEVNRSTGAISFKNGNVDVGNNFSVTGNSGAGTSTLTERFTVQDGSFLQQGGTASETYTPIQIGSISITNPQWVKVVGQYAYVITDSAINDLQIINISDPTSPSLVSTHTLGSSPHWADVAGRYVYVVDDGSQDLKIIDVSNPKVPVTRGTLSMGTNVNFITVSGKYAYITEETAGVLKIVDISDPDTPELISTTAVSTGFPRSVVVSDGFAYINGTGATDFNIIDVSDPTAPSAVGSLVTGSFGEYIAVSGNYVYYPDQNDTPTVVRIIDVSDRTTPVEVSEATLSVTAFPRSLRVSGDYLYVADEADSDLWVFNISDRTAPALVGKLDITGGVGPNSMDILGKNLYIVDGAIDNLRVYDISGINVQSAIIHSLWAGSGQILDDLDVGKDLRVGSGLTVGGSALIGGDLSINGDITFTGTIQNPTFILEGITPFISYTTGDIADNESLLEGMIVLSFVTGSDITTDQIIWEVGATAVGTALRISSGNFEIASGDSSNIDISTPALANTTYTAIIHVNAPGNIVALYLRQTADRDIVDANDFIGSGTMGGNDWSGNDPLGIGVVGGTDSRLSGVSFTGTILDATLDFYSSGPNTTPSQGNQIVGGLVETDNSQKPSQDVSTAIQFDAVSESSSMQGIAFSPGTNQTIFAMPFTGMLEATGNFHFERTSSGGEVNFWMWFEKDDAGDNVFVPIGYTRHKPLASAEHDVSMINLGSIAVNEGDQIRVMQRTDGSLSDGVGLLHGSPAFTSPAQVVGCALKLELRR